MEHLSIAFIGAGNMTSAIVSGMVKNGYPSQLITASNRSLPKLEKLNADLGINITQDNLEAVAQSDVVVLAVKPQFMQEMCAPLVEAGAFEGKLFISIAAGLTCERLYEFIGGKHALVRTMPNTPSAVGKGLTGLFSENASQAQRDFTEALFNMVGTTVWAKDEAQINTVIAGAGSSPAYFFLFLDAMQQKAEAMGFEPQDARNMVQQAMLGAAELVCASPDVSLKELRERVMSKGGTTAKAVEYFQDHQLEDIVSGAMQAAVDRADEMSKLF
ncbi:pyrroline-5-carboxylate reductase [Alteromonas sp. a30]|uniref:pyrroline-5-carboxylate reductase n=1 Tax=Alteromonas sp. a30 TaxID=2730917 RepID=UPI0022802AE7|nr:pyrroline-5-carboxylate reductase [Alteromonas sp. a30]MCY7296126.1 pyrroline-5-carboxylate reductase [Alteromonas sp. a30]